ncbi:glycogen [starch] [Lates japonicus]|uniref:Glycogen [starch] n=1 Tax=Lates japonicus TaxID=270547 RepID=A0AAD3MER1_LATJO|nr:glycogen [starch] [Lates japonicus]
MDRDCGINRLHTLQPPDVTDHEQADGRSATPAQCPITANSIVSLLLSNGHFPKADKDFTRLTSARVQELPRAPGCDTNLSNEFTTQEIELAIQRLRTSKAPGIDGIHPEYIKHQGKKTTNWLCSFLSE